MLQDEKKPGVHIAFGDPYRSQTHADWTTQTHVDALTRECDVWIDDDQVIEKGHYLLQKVDLRRAEQWRLDHRSCHERALCPSCGGRRVRMTDHLRKSCSQP